MNVEKNCRTCTNKNHAYCEAYKMPTDSFFIKVRVENCEKYKNQAMMIKKYQDINKSNLNKGLIEVYKEDLLIDYCYIAHLGHLIATIDNYCNENKAIRYEFEESTLRLRNGATLL